MSKHTKRSEILSLDVGDLIADKYRILSRDNNQSEGVAVPLGDGGSGVVYLADQELYRGISVKRAIKFYVLRDDISELPSHESSGPISASSFKDEIVNIGGFHHENLVKVIETGYFRRPNLDEEIPFLVMEYIQGRTLQEAIEDKSLAQRLHGHEFDVITLLQQLFASLQYLHRNKFYHCDVASKNIFLTYRDDDVLLVLGDLGIGRSIPSNLEDVKNSKFYLAGTRRYSPPEVESHLNTEISYAQFASLQPTWDIFAAILVAKELVDSLIGSLTEVPSWLRAVERMLDSETASSRFKDIESLSKWFAWLHPSQRIIGDTPELSDSGGRSVLLPVASINMSDRVQSVSNHPALLRLKHVPQLIMSSAIFAAANHSRYEHSLGVYQLMRKVLISLMNDSSFLSFFSPAYCETALLSGLLSNVTRFPFSSFVHELHSNDQNFFRDLTKKDLLTELLTWKDDGDGGDSFSDRISKEFPRVDREILLSILSDDLRELDPGLRFIHFILNCSLDVRVLDYVLRDSHHLGISEGRTTDIDELLRNIRFHNAELAIGTAGLSAVEQIICLRFWLFNRVYWNSPNRCLAAMLKYILIELHDKDPELAKELRKKCLQMSQDDFLVLLEQRANSIGHAEAVRLCNLLKRDRPILFRGILQINRAVEDASMNRICEGLSHLSIRQTFQIQKRLNSRIAEMQNLNKDGCHVLLDFPTESGRLKFGEDINVITHTGSTMRLERFSGIVAGAAQGFKEQLQRVRVFLDPKIAMHASSSAIDGMKEEILKELSLSV